MLVEGRNHNPTLCDMVSELYATVSTDRLRHLLFDSKLGLREVQIGQGCGSLTMPMTDMRLSAMTAGLTEHLVEELQQPHDHGQIVIGTTEDNHTDTIWIRQTVAAFEVLPIESAKGWTLRISQRVLEMLHSEVAYHPRVETGGVLIGTCNSRLMVVTVVDLLPAPPDSIRSSTRFVLGTSRLQDMIMERHNASGGALFDVGTWHSHLDDQGPSPLDRQTALELGAERPPPAVLLIATPRRYHALMHMGAKS
ncbi:hypothetical protein BZY95_16805 [Billgrantia desiderata SP1]|nr:hypothetical protein BZY95_16805 [Halomonas desiderata SP1]